MTNRKFYINEDQLREYIALKQQQLAKFDKSLSWPPLIKQRIADEIKILKNRLPIINPQSDEQKTN